MNILIDNEINPEEWMKLAAENPFASPFQTQTFFNFISSINNMEARVFAVEESKILSALCVTTIQKEKGIKGFFSERVIIYGGPLLTESKEAAIFLLNYIRKYFSRAIYLEIRNLSDYSFYSDVYKQCGFKYENYVNFIVDISQMETTVTKFNSEKRRQIKKALASGVTIQTAKHKKEVEALYNILCELYSVKVKKPLPELNYFLNLFDMFQKYNNGFICILIYNGGIIGGAFCPHINKTVYDWYRCGLDNEYKKLYPSALSVYAGMAIGNELGFKQYDFMGAGNADTPYGVRDFKSQFGGSLVEYGRYIKINNYFLYTLGKTVINISSKLRDKN